MVCFFFLFHFLLLGLGVGLGLFFFLEVLLEGDQLDLVDQIGVLGDPILLLAKQAISANICILVKFLDWLGVNHEGQGGCRGLGFAIIYNKTFSVKVIKLGHK